jgi:hypothetical protein
VLDLQKPETIRRESQLENGIINGQLTSFLEIHDVRIGDILEYAYTIKGFNAEGVYYSHMSSLESMLHKNLLDNKVYSLPVAFVAICQNEVKKTRKNIPICFISNSHTTGGNSGSPVLDKKGRLIGLNFDRVAYGLVSDYQYLQEWSRQIAVDIRYIRFVLEHQLKAVKLLEEWN